MLLTTPNSPPYKSAQTKYGESPVAEITPTRLIAISEETKHTIQTFYQRDDITQQAPGRRDIIIIRNGNERKKQSSGSPSDHHYK